MTKLSEARARVSEAEAAVAAVKARQDAEEAARRPATAALARHEKRYSVPTVVLAGGSYKILPGIPSMEGWGWNGLDKTATAKTAQAKTEAVAAALAAGEVGFSVGGTQLKAKGLSAKMRTLTDADMRRWKAARAKVTKAQVALSAAQRAEREVITSAYTNGGRIPIDELSVIAAKGWLLKRAAKGTDSWTQDRNTREAREVYEAAQVHLNHVRSAPTDQLCICARCEKERFQAEYAANLARITKERERDDAARAKVKARAPWRSFTCPSCFHESTAQVLPDRNDRDSLSCRNCYHAWLVGNIKSKPAPKPAPKPEPKEAAA